MTRLMPLILLATFIVIRTSEGAAAHEPSVPPVIAAGFAAYKADGGAAAVRTWLKGGPLESSAGVASQASAMNQINDYYGPYQSFDVVQIHQVSPRLQIFYLVMNCQHGAIFGRFILFKDGDVWVVLKLDINTEIDRILPGHLLVH